jgi:vacuolar-type H+-ATPase subunit I/STV1
MKPQQSVYNILAKAQVRKVEFAIADDLSKIASDLDSLYSQHLDAVQEIEKLEAEYKQYLQVQKAVISLAKKANKSVNASNKYFDKVSKATDTLAKYEDMANRLGVNPKESAEYNKADAAWVKGRNLTSFGGGLDGRVNEIKRGLGI